MPKPRANIDIDNEKNYTGLRTSRRSQSSMSVRQLERRADDVEQRHAELISIDKRVRTKETSFQSHELALLMSAVEPVPEKLQTNPPIEVFSLKSLRPVPCDICGSSQLCRRLGVVSNEASSILCQACVQNARMSGVVPAPKSGGPANANAKKTQQQQPQRQQPQRQQQKRAQPAAPPTAPVPGTINMSAPAAPAVAAPAKPDAKKDIESAAARGKDRREAAATTARQAKAAAMLAKARSK